VLQKPAPRSEGPMSCIDRTPMDSEGLLEEAAVSRWEVVGESRTL